MQDGKQKKSAAAKTKQGGKFPSKNIKHDPAAESARAVFGLKDAPQSKG